MKDIFFVLSNENKTIVKCVFQDKWINIDVSFLDQIVYRFVEEEYNTSLECKEYEKKHKIKQIEKNWMLHHHHLQKQKL